MKLPNKLSLSLTHSYFIQCQTFSKIPNCRLLISDLIQPARLHVHAGLSQSYCLLTQTHIQFLYFIVKINMWPGAKDTVSIQHVKTLYVKLPMEYLEYLYISAWSVWEFQWFVDPNPINIDFNISFIFHHLSHQYLMTASLCPLLQIEEFYRNHTEHMQSFIV